MVGYLENDTLRLKVDVIIDEKDFQIFLKKFESAKCNQKTDVLLTYEEDLNLDMLVDYLLQKYRAVFHRKSDTSEVFLVAIQRIH